MDVQRYSMHIKPETFYVNSSNNLLGVIYHSVGHVSFPGEGWTDFVPFVVAESANAAHRLRDQAGHSATIHFMDGPYYIYISRVAANRLQVEFVHRREKPQTQHRLMVDERQFLQEIVDTTGLFIARCKELEWQSKDLDEIASLHAALLRS